MRYTGVTIERLKEAPGKLKEGSWYLIEFTLNERDFTHIAAVYRYQTEDEVVVYDTNFESTETSIKILKRILQMERYNTVQHRDFFPAIDDNVSVPNIHWDAHRTIVIDRFVEDVPRAAWPNDATPTNVVTKTVAPRYKTITATNYKELLHAGSEVLQFSA